MSRSKYFAAETVNDENFRCHLIRSPHKWLRSSFQNSSSPQNQIQIKTNEGSWPYRPLTPSFTQTTLLWRWTLVLFDLTCETQTKNCPWFRPMMHFFLTMTANSSETTTTICRKGRNTTEASTQRAIESFHDETTREEGYWKWLPQKMLFTRRIRPPVLQTGALPS